MALVPSVSSILDLNITRSFFHSKLVSKSSSFKVPGIVASRRSVEVAPCELQEQEMARHWSMAGRRMVYIESITSNLISAFGFASYRKRSSQELLVENLHRSLDGDVRGSTKSETTNEQGANSLDTSTSSRQEPAYQVK